jgi:hypothetical protein
MGGKGLSVYQLLDNPGKRGTQHKIKGFAHILTIFTRQCHEALDFLQIPKSTICTPTPELSFAFQKQVIKKKYTSQSVCT